MNTGNLLAPEITVAMPCLDEAQTVGSCIDKAQVWFRRRGVAGEVVIGDNGSTDGSQLLSAARGARVVAVSQRGYGAAVRGAVLAARGRYVVMGDSDDSYDFSDLDAFLDQLRAGNHLVLGNRFRGGIDPGAMPWMNRWIGNPLLSGLGRLLFPTPLRDWHCGLRGFSRDAFHKLDGGAPGMEFASQMVILAVRQNLRVSEVPVRLSVSGRPRAPHLRPWRDGLRHVRLIVGSRLAGTLCPIIPSICLTGLHQDDGGQL